MLLPSAAVRHRDMFGIVLVVTLKLEKVVVSTAFLIRKFPTYLRADAIHRAATFVSIEEAANASEMRILFASHDTLVAMV